MASYVPPLRDIRFVLEQLIDLDGLSKLEAFCHADPDTVFGVIEESGRFMADVVGPLNQVGDTTGSTLDADGKVTTPPGFAKRTGSMSRPAGGRCRSRPSLAAVGSRGWSRS